MSDNKDLPVGLALTALDPEFREHPQAVLDRLRSAAPVHHDSAGGRWFLTRFDDVKAVVGNRALMVDPRKAAPGSYHRRVVIGDAADFAPSMLHMDDPDHRRIRGLVSQAFNQRAIEAFRSRIQAIADGLLDALGPDLAGFNVIADYAAPLPTVVIAEMLSVDTADQAQFKLWSDALVHSFNPRRTPAQEAELDAARGGLFGYLRQVVDARRASRGSDLISALVSAEESGDRLSEQEIISTCNLLLVAGNVTTTDLIGNGMFALLRHPAQMTALRAEPALIRNAVEEMLRFDPPVVTTGRLTQAPTEIGGVTVGPSESVTACIMAAAHDPAAHADPHRFDIRRGDTTHMAFGGGAHFCLGAPLARAEAQIAIGTLLARFPNLRLDPAYEPQHKAAPVFNGLAALPVLTG